tara:strand:+ start:265 stop:555 length:291 start_codon:yes stop_codon:yes gene_type:complete
VDLVGNLDLVLQVKPLGLDLTDNLDLGLVLHHLWISDHEDFSLMHLYLLPVLLDLDLMDNLDLMVNLDLVDNLDNHKVLYHQLLVANQRVDFSHYL